MPMISILTFDVVLSDHEAYINSVIGFMSGLVATVQGACCILHAWLHVGVQ